MYFVIIILDINFVLQISNMHNVSIVNNYLTYFSIKIFLLPPPPPFPSSETQLEQQTILFHLMGKKGGGGVTAEIAL